uniref:Uncharacterized protein n=1 Tax=Salix viminalis TaxID=40686 RepID=A0A6N2MLW9_SALVM
MDIFLRYFDQSNEQGGTVEKEGYLYQNLKRLKHEKEMLEQIAKSYNPDVVNINAIHDANAHRQFLFDAIQNIEKLSMEIFHEPIDLQKSESLQVTLPATRDAHLTAEELVYANGNRNLSQDDHQPKEAHLPVGPHLTLEYLRTQKHWNLQGRGQGNA